MHPSMVVFSGITIGIRIFNTFIGLCIQQWKVQGCYHTKINDSKAICSLHGSMLAIMSYCVKLLMHTSATITTNTVGSCSHECCDNYYVIYLNICLYFLVSSNENCCNLQFRTIVLSNFTTYTQLGIFHCSIYWIFLERFWGSVYNPLSQHIPIYQIFPSIPLLRTPLSSLW